MPSYKSSKSDLDSNEFADATGREAEIAYIAGGLAHEIRNPLSTIRLNMELLAEELAMAQTPEGSRSRKRIETVQKECQRLSDLLDNFLDYAKVRPARLEPSDLNTEMNEALDFFELEAGQTGIKFLRYLDPELPSVLLDREQFRGAILNLLINAKQAMPNGGELIVRTLPKGEVVVLQLIDSGEGMDEATASRMFEAFYTTKPGGSGLGLPTAQKIIAAHGGRISVQSSVGRGTQFVIELPALHQIPEKKDAEN